jgi:hypothetical protein
MSLEPVAEYPVRGALAQVVGASEIKIKSVEGMQGILDCDAGVSRN